MDRRRLSRRTVLRSGLAMAGAGLATPLLMACGGEPAQRSGEGETKLTAWFTDRRSINQMTEKEAIPEFEARNPGIKVELQFVPEAQIQQKLLAATAAKNAPAITAIDETFLDNLWKSKALLSFPDPLIDVRKEMGARTADLYKLPPGSSQGAYFGLPNGHFGGVLYYNADLLKQLNYTPEQIPDKWDDFIRWAKELTVWKGDTLERTGFTVFGTDDSLRGEYRVQQGGWQDGNIFPTKEKVSLARDLEYEAVRWVLDLYDVHKLDARDGVTYQEKFGTGKAVTTFAWTWNNGFFETQYKMENYGIKITPHVAPGRGGPLGAAGPDVGFCGTTQATDQKQVEATWKLWRYLVGPDYLKRYCKLRGVQPSLRSMTSMPEFSEDRSGPKWAALAKKMQPGNNLDSGFTSVELGEILSRAWAPIRDEKADPKQVLANVEQQANEYLRTHPQWSILSAADYRQHPEWLKPEG